MQYVFVAISFIAGLALLFLLFKDGFKSVPNQERWLIEVFGKYSHTFKPGLNFLFPGIEKVRAAISVWEQTIPLFISPIKIDFTDGSATPKGAEVFVKIKNPDLPYLACDGKTETGVYRAIYEIGNWREAVRALAENAIRSHLNGMTIDEGITLKGAGFDLKSKLPPEEVVRIEGDLDGWGLELLRVTITDFDLDPEIIKARGDVQVHLREAQASEFKRQEIARGTMGAFVQMIAEATGKKFEKVQEEIGSDPEMKERLLKFSEDLIIRRMSIDGKSLNDVRVSGGGDLEQILLRLFTALKGKPEEKEKKYEEKNFGKDKNRERSREDGQ